MEEDIKILKGFLEECKHELMLTKNCWALEMKEVLPRMCFNENTVQALENILNRLEQDEQIIKGQEKTIEEQIEKIEQLNKELLQYQDLESALQDYYGITREAIEETIKEETLIL